MNDEKIHFATVATQSEGYLPVLEQQLTEKNLKLNKLAMGKKWKGHMMKDLEMIDYLKTVDDEDIVVFLDGFDTLMLSSREEILEKFKSFNSKMVLSIENVGKLSFIHDAVFEKINGYYFNAGLYMGRAKFMLNFLEDMYSNDYDKRSNQKTWMKYLNRLNSINKLDGIKFDVNSDIFLNHSFTTNNYPYILDKRVFIYDSKPCFIQGNGREDMSYIIKETGHAKYDIHRNEFYYKKASYNTRAVFRVYPIISYYIFLIIFVAIIVIFLIYVKYKSYNSKYFYL